MSLEKFIVYLLICFFLSFFIGIERQYRRRSLGLRTMILIAIGSYLFVSFSFMLSGYDIDVYREANEDDDVELREFVGTDEGDIEQWIVDELRKVGLNTAKSVLDKETDALVNLTDLEEETIEEVKRILREELED